MSRTLTIVVVVVGILAFMAIGVALATRVEERRHLSIKAFSRWLWSPEFDRERRRLRQKVSA